MCSPAPRPRPCTAPPRQQRLRLEHSPTLSCHHYRPLRLPCSWDGPLQRARVPAVLQPGGRWGKSGAIAALPLLLAHEISAGRRLLAGACLAGHGRAHVAHRPPLPLPAAAAGATAQADLPPEEKAKFFVQYTPTLYEACSKAKLELTLRAIQVGPGQCRHKQQCCRHQAHAAAASGSPPSGPRRPPLLRVSMPHAKPSLPVCLL